MRKSLSILAACALAAGAGPIVTASAQQSGMQSRMRAATGGGRLLSLDQIEARVLPSMRGMQYLGPEFDPVAMAYRLKFISRGRVVFVDVDGHTGRIIGEHR
jgi:hypothetical protein